MLRLLLNGSSTGLVSLRSCFEPDKSLWRLQEEPLAITAFVRHRKNLAILPSEWVTPPPPPTEKNLYRLLAWEYSCENKAGEVVVSWLLL